MVWCNVNILLKFNLGCTIMLLLKADGNKDAITTEYRRILQDLIMGIVKLYKNKHGGDGSSHFWPLTILNEKLKILTRSKNVQQGWPLSYLQSASSHTFTLGYACSMWSPLRAIVEVKMSLSGCPALFLKIACICLCFKLLCQNSLLTRIMLPSSTTSTRYSAYTNDILMHVTSDIKIEKKLDCRKQWQNYNKSVVLIKAVR